MPHRTLLLSLTWCTERLVYAHKHLFRALSGFFPDVAMKDVCKSTQNFTLKLQWSESRKAKGPQNMND